MRDPGLELLLEDTGIREPPPVEHVVDSAEKRIAVTNIGSPDMEGRVEGGLAA
jgi:hypothetical protein